MLDYDILKQCGTTNERLREILTATMPGARAAAKLDRKQLKRIEKDIRTRQEIEALALSRLTEHVVFSLSNHHLYSAVDLAWDSTPIHKTIIPLMLYAQQRIDISAALKSLGDLPSGDKYIQKNDQGQAVAIHIPKFCETNVNLVRSIITRRTAAQHNKYAGLFPWFKYESRSTGLVGKLRADAVSQKADETCDHYGWRHTQEQITRDLFLYGHVVSFPRAAWEREVAWVKDGVAPEFGSGAFRKKARVVKEGISWVVPHPTRLFWDNHYPLATLNSDSGCEYVGFWDVERYGDLDRNPAYFNRNCIAYGTSSTWLIGNDTYFQQYFDRISVPQQSQDPTAANDRQNNVGVYSSELRDASVFTAHYYWKIKPREYDLGTYPYPIWIHLKVAGDGTVIFAEIMPSSPAAVFPFNESDNRLVNISVAHELMSYQDQLTNLFSQLLEVAKADLFSVAVLNEDIFPNTDEGQKVKEQFKRVMAGKEFYATTQVLVASFSQLQELGISPTPDNIFKIVRSSPNTQITALFNAIAQLIAMAERLMNLSPQEQGQPAPREITAEETRLIGGTTESVYSFISSALDEGRAAQKRIYFESLVACGSSTLFVPIVNRYPREIVERAGFRILDEDTGEVFAQGQGEYNLAGPRECLVHDYIFTTRDGGDRSPDTQAAEVLGKLLQGLGQMQPALAQAVFSAMGKQKLFMILNEIFRRSGAGLDVVFELKPGEDDALMLSDDEQLMGLVNQLAAMVKQNSLDVQALARGHQPASAPPSSGSS